MAAIRATQDQQRGRRPVEPGAALRRRQAAAARRRRAAVAVPDRLPDLWHAERRALQRHPGLPRADRRPACRQHQSGDRQARLVGRADRPRQDHRHRPLLRHLLQRHRRLPGLDRPGLDQSRRPASPTASTCRSSPSATWCARRRCWSTISASTSCSAWSAARWAACRCWNGRRAIPSASSRRCRSPPARAIPRRTSPSTRSAGRRSWPIRTGMAATISRPASGPEKGLAVARMAAHITYLSESGAAPQVRPQSAGPRQR